MHRIDVHHHFVPPAYRDAMSRQGIQKVAGAALPEWHAQASLDVMNENGIQAALLSISAPGVYFGDLEAARARSHVNVTNLRRSFAMRIPAASVRSRFCRCRLPNWPVRKPFTRSTC